MKKYKIFIIFIFTGFVGQAQTKDNSSVNNKSVSGPTIATIKFAKEKKKSAQKNVSLFFSSSASYISDNDTVRSKSERTAKPTIIRVSRNILKYQVLIRDLIPNIPDSCSFISCQITASIKGQTKFFTNRGNAIFNSVLLSGDFMVIENLRSTCPKSHKANYKIIFQ